MRESISIRIVNGIIAQRVPDGLIFHSDDNKKFVRARWGKKLKKFVKCCHTSEKDVSIRFEKITE